VAPPRKKKRAPGEGHPVHLRLPPDVFEWVEGRAKDQRWPFNRAVINLLADIPNLERQRDQEMILEDMRNVLAAYGSRVTLAELNEPLLRALDEFLAAPAGDSKRRLEDKLRVFRNNMLKQERESKA
jgi:hypothetical protein